MKLRLLPCLMILFFIGVVTFEPATTGQIQPIKTEDRPLKVTVCQLRNDRAAYDKKLIEVTGFILHGFEEFTITDPACPTWSDIWLEYGGTTASNTMYCCGVTPAHTRPKPLVVQHITIELVADSRFKEFDTIIGKEYDTVLHATVVGRFFAGEKISYPSGRDGWAGYGHMGCCSLFAIQQVVSVDPHTSRDLDYRSSPDYPDINKVGCGYSDLTDREAITDQIKTQEKADRGEDEWVFNDPKRVASNGLAKLLSVDEKSIELRLTRQAPGRFVYKWLPKTRGNSYMVVASRPYRLSFYAKDPGRVAWVVLAAYKVGCGEDKAVRRIK